MSSENDKIIEKAITTSTIASGGALNTDQQNKFVTLIRSYGNLLSQVRFVRMRHATQDIDKLHISEPMTVSASEGTTSSDSYAPKFNKVTLTARKIRTDWAMTTELLQENLEQDGFESTLFSGITERMATDLELLAIQGDISTYTGSTTASGKLLARLDGWDLLTAGTHIVDAGGSAVSKSIFSIMKRQLPKHYRNDAGYRWMMSDDIVTDWMDTVADRGTALGDAALQGSGVAPYGIPIMQIPMIPDDKTVSNLVAAQPAVVIGDQFGPFALTSASGSFAIVVDGATSPSTTVTVTSTTATLDPSEVARLINAALVANVGSRLANVARVTPDGRLMLVSPTTGTGSAIVLSESGSPDDCLAALGFTAGTTTGTAAGVGTSKDGTFIWLSNPMNFIYGVLDGTRIFTEFNKDADQIEAVIYNQVAVQVENVDAIVKCTGLRKKASF